ncbi:LysR family transcriptional regulator [Ensifer adhaerens]|uniref:LysR family transcriptional regulator n=1 Tax=Ensifer adhaerens TaxID=106592 RepID=UPI001CBCBB08|nr:LysR family transcriptional regulator [Ensifer adhaerens]MBZ7924174.1 LysR family transcriptional regulator [Ensifer adhaerens]UAX96568.1 LysR family transcriptional regulator [Ensifer adhaerens]UAY04088.1 LysR family transcriptional regulator [Ensifer adhaerens]UAY12074.1 LysR family transcriptional regulator [Ensifer adhaerens]
MDMFAAVKAFVAVVNEGAFSRAAKQLGLATSSVTRQVDSLEAHLRTILINRSTRRLTLTDAGTDYYDSALQIMQDLEEANASAALVGNRVHGSLRVNAPVAFGQLYIAPQLPKFLERYPNVEIDLTLTDQIVNLIDDRVDVAVRLGQVEMQSLITRRLGSNQRVACATKEYLSKRGLPLIPDELTSHNCLTFNYGKAHRFWTFTSQDEARRVRVQGNLRVNNSIVLRHSVLKGVGVGLLPVWLIADDLRTGALTQILSQWEVVPNSPGDINAVYLPNRRGSPKVRAFIDFLAEVLNSALPVAPAPR